MILFQAKYYEHTTLIIAVSIRSNENLMYLSLNMDSI